MRRIRILLLMVIASFLLMGVPGVLAAEQVSLYLKPSESAVKVGENLTVDIWLQAANEQVNAVQSNLRYDPTLLDFLAVDSAGSAFSVQAEANGGQGEVKIARGTLGTISGEQFIAKVTFKPIRNGTVAIDFTDKSKVIRPKDVKNVLQGTAGGTYNLRIAGTSTKRWVVWGSGLLVSLILAVIAALWWFRRRRHKAAVKARAETTVIGPPGNTDPRL